MTKQTMYQPKFGGMKPQKQEVMSLYSADEMELFCANAFSCNSSGLSAQKFRDYFFAGFEKVELN